MWKKRIPCSFDWKSQKKMDNACQKPLKQSRNFIRFRLQGLEKVEALADNFAKIAG